MFTSPGEIAFSLFNFNIHWYGIIMSLAMLSGLGIIFVIKSKYYEDISDDAIVDLAFYLIIAGILGARLYYVLMDFGYYIKHPLEIIQVWNGGLSIHGAIIGASVAGFIYTKKNEISFFRIADLFIYGLVVGQIVGRWGNFFNSEAFGGPTDLPWKLFIPLDSRPISFVNCDYFHPTFLYESLLNLMVFLILFFVIRKIAKDKDGLILFSYFILYSAVRFFVEGIRIDSVLDIGAFPIAQIVSIVLLIIGIVGIIYLLKMKPEQEE